MPIKAFWLMNANLDRLNAETDIRQLSLLVNSTNGENVKAKHEELKAQMGMIFQEKPKLDKKGLAELLAMAGKKR